MARRGNVAGPGRGPLRPLAPPPAGRAPRRHAARDRRVLRLVPCCPLLPARAVVLVAPPAGTRRPLCYPGDPPDPVTALPRRPSFSPDGTRVVYAALAGTHPQVFVADVP